MGVGHLHKVKRSKVKKKGKIASQNLNTRYILWQKVKISQQIMSQSHKEVIVQNMEGNCLGTLGISQS